MITITPVLFLSLTLLLLLVLYLYLYLYLLEIRHQPSGGNGFSRLPCPVDCERQKTSAKEVECEGFDCFLCMSLVHDTSFTLLQLRTPTRLMVARVTADRHVHIFKPMPTNPESRPMNIISSSSIRVGNQIKKIPHETV